MRRQILPIEQLQAWSYVNGIQLLSAAIVSNIGDGELDKGAGLVCTREIADTDGEAVLLTVPSDLILCKERVEESAKIDQDLQDVLNAAGVFAQSPRIAILIFLLLQVTHSSPDIAGRKVGVANPFTDYVKFLPAEILLPTFYTSYERDLLHGTSLKDALDQKMSRLDREFALLRERTQTIPWCQRHWWDADTGRLSFDDWKQVDALYRSRALDLPGIGDAMVPLVDMANHASDEDYVARFDIQPTGEAVLMMRDRKTLRPHDEITIMYGAGGACETIFSYGFLDPSTGSAREIFLTFDIPADDPLRLAKQAAAAAEPGLRLYADGTGAIHWESAYVWWACVNEEDGLDFQVSQTHDGTRELTAVWKEEELADATHLERCLVADESADLFRLRALVSVQQRVQEQGTALQASQESYEGAVDHPLVRWDVWASVGRLRELELDLLGQAFDALEEQKAQLMPSPAVQQYLETGARGSVSRAQSGGMED